MKAEAVRQFAQVLQQHGVEYREDVAKVEGNAAYPHLTPRALDYAIWQYQRVQE